METGVICEVRNKYCDVVFKDYELYCTTFRYCNVFVSMFLLPEERVGKTWELACSPHSGEIESFIFHFSILQQSLFKEHELFQVAVP
jgi:hypothetical protein